MTRHRPSRHPVQHPLERPDPESRQVSRVRVLVIDNYDSFVFNLVQYLGPARRRVRRAAQRRDHRRRGRRGCAAAGVLLSPGPGTPERAGIMHDADRAVRRAAPDLRRLPGTPGDRRGVRRDRDPRAGAAARQDLAGHHEGAGVLAGLPDPFTATRYHSLAVVEYDAARRDRGHRAHASPAW